MNLSGPQLAVVLVFDVVLAVLGYYLAEADKRNLGRAPWGVSSIGWAAILFLGGLLGLALWFVAHRGEVRRASHAPFGSLGRGPVPPTGAPSRSVANDFPAYPRPADGGGRSPGAGPPPAPPIAPSPTGTQSTPPGWHADPGGRFHYRWWTGSEWTSYVATHGQVIVDTDPDQRIGPY